ncbi:MAG: metallophosphoesterase family protein [Nanobdellota archaeon]
MRFAHIADCHLGGWREPRMKEINHQAFNTVIDEIIEQEVDFLLISGDLFNTSFPDVDSLRLAIKRLKDLNGKGIRVYIIAGSHDYSPSGKTMLDIIEEAGLATNVVKGEVEDNKLKLKFTEDNPTGAKITGMLGKRGMLDRQYYESLERENLETEEGFKIFLFHTTVSELKPKRLEKIEGSPISLLPKGFDYYAGGHVHITRHENMDDYRNVVYPGPTYPNNFTELEELGMGSYYIYDEGDIRRKEIIPKGHESIKIDCANRKPDEVSRELRQKLSHTEDKIITLRMKGQLIGKLSEINFREIFDDAYSRGAYFIMKNTTAVSTEKLNEVKVKQGSMEEIEDEVINEHIGQISVDLDNETETTKKLIQNLDIGKEEGENKHDFEKRIIDTMDKILEE